MKSLDDCRSLSIQRADTVSEKAVRPMEFTGVAVANDPGSDAAARCGGRERGAVLRSVWLVSSLSKRLKRK